MLCVGSVVTTACVAPVDAITTLRVTGEFLSILVQTNIHEESASIVVAILRNA